LASVEPVDEPLLGGANGVRCLVQIVLGVQVTVDDYVPQLAKGCQRLAVDAQVRRSHVSREVTQDGFEGVFKLGHL